jgi:predicted metal-dependent phosphoesterase TrpH
MLVIGIVAGTLADYPGPHTPMFAGGYRVLAADFHTHSSFASDGALTPFGLVLEAQRQGLDVIAITGHNEVADSRLGQWFAREIAGSVTVLPGEEIVAPSYHIIGVGMDQAVGYRQDAADTIEDVHRHGGVAIAAHPDQDFSKGFSSAAVAKLDGAEICHPLIYERARGQSELEAFAARGNLAAIGSSDYHGLGRMGSCRTFVFSSDTSEAAIIEAIRRHRTVVFGRGGKAYGDPALVRLAETTHLRDRLPRAPRSGWADWISRISGVIGLSGLVWSRRTGDPMLAKAKAIGIRMPLI